MPSSAGRLLVVPLITFPAEELEASLVLLVGPLVTEQVVLETFLLVGGKVAAVLGQVAVESALQSSSSTPRELSLPQGQERVGFDAVSPGEKGGN